MKQFKLLQPEGYWRLIADVFQFENQGAQPTWPLFPTF
jgi:hypothetical protein